MRLKNGCGVYLDEIEKELQRKEEIFKEHINEQIISIHFF